MKPEQKKIKKILVANRGEIAARVFRTASELGLGTVALYSDADRHALFVGCADEAYGLGGVQAAESYLDQSAVLDIARRAGVDAIHPGYGFLSENPVFAQRCAEEGIVFVGPPVDAIRLMGDKAQAKKVLQEKAPDVPFLPGYNGQEQSPERLQEEADRIGFPLMIKAAAGGGGKGMRIVREASGFMSALEAARRESGSAFGNDHVILERYLEGPKHIEVQIMADCHGKVLALSERDCSAQRRYQKVIEEAPAPHLSDVLRERLAAAACSAARAVDYAGAGTVEFLVQGEEFFFLEMNTRLQVEHPVTEEILGLDLVALQIVVASGEALPLDQEDLKVSGHAFEARLYAERPEKGFLPATGQIDLFEVPERLESEGRVRLDSAVRSGDRVTPYYDPMIAKLVVHGKNRAEALSGLREAVRKTLCHGVGNNLDFLHDLLSTGVLQDGLIDTGWLDRNLEQVLDAAEPLSPLEIAACAFAILFLGHQNDKAGVFDRGDFFSNATLQRRPLLLSIGGQLVSCSCVFEKGLSLSVLVGDQSVAVEELERNEREFRLRLDGELELALSFRHVGTEMLVLLPGRRSLPVCLAGVEELATQGSVEKAQGVARDLVAPMPGRVVKVEVEAGQEVLEGQAVVVLEAMKMELPVTATGSSVVDGLFCKVGDQVAEGQMLCSFRKGSDHG
ncbi:ATP-binding protein [Kiloniella sp. b19]|uniref:ATP-binding protein n=1 Tax=Kiloniella sp. GXU_MW_B19 TaxID=3141326 RepID=UPI0031E1D6AA